MRRTQLYLDDDLWNALNARARNLGTSISELVPEAVRERYAGNLDQRRKAMQGFVGMRKGRSKFGNPEAYVRGIRRGRRLKRLY